MPYVFYAYDSSQATISSGSVNYLFAYDSSQETISGGSVILLYASNSSQITMTGGSISYHLEAFDSSQVTVSGGTITAGLLADNTSKMIIDGSNFAIDGTPVGFGDITSILGGSSAHDPHRILTGTLANGDIINTQFQIGNQAEIVLTPEPATLLLLGLGAAVLRKKARN